MDTAGVGGGADTIILMHTTSDANYWCVGVDDSDSKSFKINIGAGSLSVGTNVLRLLSGVAEVTGTFKATGAFGCNTKTPQTAVAVNAACTDLATCIALTNQLRAALIANGICS
jgi:hypothetical protein